MDSMLTRFTAAVGVVGVASCLSVPPVADEDSATEAGTGSSSGSTSDPTNTTTSSSSSTSAGPTSGAETETSDGMSSTTTADSTGSTGGGGAIIVEAEIAVCSDPVSLDLDGCAADSGPNSMTVDTANSTFSGEPTIAWLRFALPADTPGLDSIDSVTLELTTAGAPGAAPTSGSIWLVEPFDESFLANGHPNQVEMLAPDWGIHGPNQVVDWDLPVDILAAPAIHLGVYPTATDSSSYWNNEGPVPPRLVIQPR